MSIFTQMSGTVEIPDENEDDPREEDLFLTVTFTNERHWQGEGDIGQGFWQDDITNLEYFLSNSENDLEPNEVKYETLEQMLGAAETTNIVQSAINLAQEQ